MKRDRGTLAPENYPFLTPIVSFTGGGEGRQVHI